MCKHLTNIKSIFLIYLTQYLALHLHLLHRREFCDEKITSISGTLHLESEISGNNSCFKKLQYILFSLILAIQLNLLISWKICELDAFN